MTLTHDSYNIPADIKLILSYYFLPTDIFVQPEQDQTNRK